MQPQASLELTASRSSPEVARHHARTVLRPWLTDDEIEDVALLVTELVTNSVRYAGSQIRLTIELDERCLRVEVFDESRDEPVVQDPSFDADGGRGLYLVDAIATDWGYRAEPNGKVVWFELVRSTASHQG